MSKISQNICLPKSNLQEDPASSAAIAIESRTISQRKTISQDAIPAQTYVSRLGALPSYCENAGAGASDRFLNRNSVGDSYPASSPSVRVDSERLSGRARLRIRSNLNQAWATLLAFVLGLNFPKLSGNLMRAIPCVNSYQKITPCCPSLNRDQCRVLLGHFQSPHVFLLCSEVAPSAIS